MRKLLALQASMRPTQDEGGDSEQLAASPWRARLCVFVGVHARIGLPRHFLMEPSPWPSAGHQSAIVPRTTTGAL